MSFEKCPKCHHYRWTDNCKCEPFHVDYLEWFGDEGKTIYGTSFEEVVETLAKDINEDDTRFNTNIFESPVTLTDKKGVSKRFQCIASLDVNYSVKEVTEEPHRPQGQGDSHENKPNRV